ncbi:hypothetical protein KW783_01625 [Candidatus Parcubacteria bacterium]|nr:hypothetical protein [Candidatus Parcubacteria bacterium]
MKDIIDTYKQTGNLHHAYLIEGDRESSVERLKKFLTSELKYTMLGNPDFWHSRFETMTIDDARFFREFQMRKALADNKKVVIIETDFLTREAQNSLLKIFEEPTADTHFFLVLPSAEILLPTLRSRLFISRHDSHDKIDMSDAREFVKKSPAERLLMIKDIVEEKNKAKAISFLNSLEAYLNSTLDLKKATQHELALFLEIK